ncbi:MAG: hypothetical protein WBD55_06505, partial [Dehalococcoidia bacterium]
MADQRRRRKRRGPDYTPPGRRGNETTGGAGETTQGPPQKPSGAPRSRRGGDPDRPPAPWGSFPLVELVILLALILLAAGLFVRGKQGLTMIFGGLALGVLGGTEVSIREHFAGYKSHTTLLSGVATAIVVTITFLVVPASWPRAVPFGVGAICFLACVY